MNSIPRPVRQLLLRGALGAGASQAVAGEIDTMGVVDEAVEDGVGISRVADDIVPFVDGDLAGEDGGTAAVAFFEDLVEVAAGAAVVRPANALSSPSLTSLPGDAGSRYGMSRGLPSGNRLDGSRRR
jgi:hypothetical protein